MKHLSRLLAIFLCSASSILAQVNESPIPFILNSDYGKQVQMDFYNRTEIPQPIRDSIRDLSYSDSIQENSLQLALTFLYAYMPQNDMMDYSFNFFKQQVKFAYEARETFSWGKTIPADLFRHFVLVHRVNNEDLDTARAYIFHQLKDRIQNMSMYEAALEVNHWCHEHVDYQPADIRTSAPLATLRTSHGRCGEESTLTVTALRAVGIPARQCYTPRWAHCDDNHAWVEVWIDGKWHFLGACEPDPELDMGWFAVPSSRTMMVHTNVFGKYNGPEEVNHKTPYYSCINVLPNYAATTHVTVTVVNNNNEPVKDATVRFKLYNYAEYYTLASRQTDDAGHASIITGKGDLLIWVSKGEQYNYAKIDCRSQNNLTLKLDGQHRGKTYTELLDMNPPIGGTTLSKTTTERQALNDRRKIHEDSLREAYRASWPTKETLAQENFHNANFTDKQLYDIISRSEGNYNEIIKFLNHHDTLDEHFLIAEYIQALSDKDLRDVSAMILEDQLFYYQPERYPKEVFIKGVLPARISNELIRPDRTILGVCLKHLFHTLPSLVQLKQYVHENISVNNECNYYHCPISPMGVLEGKLADQHSLSIFFVALCRSFGIPAYMDNSNGELYAWENDVWTNVKLSPKNDINTQDTSATAITSTITLHNPNHYTYYIHYTLQRFENGEYISYDFENDPRIENNPIVLNVPAGEYCLSTGSRYSNGDVLSKMEFFTVGEHQNVEHTITLRSLKAREHNYGLLDVDQTYVDGQSLQSRMSNTGKNRLILCLVTPGTEPVNHLIKELESKQEEYETWNGPMVFIANNDKWKSNKKLPQNISVTQNQYATTLIAILKGLVEKHEGQDPVCLVVDQNGTIRFFSEGYHIGLGNLLLNEVENNK